MNIAVLDGNKILNNERFVDMGNPLTPHLRHQLLQGS